MPVEQNYNRKMNLIAYHFLGTAVLTSGSCEPAEAAASQSATCSPAQGSSSAKGPSGRRSGVIAFVARK